MSDAPSDQRSCTCHPSEAFTPCRHQYAWHACALDAERAAHAETREQSRLAFEEERRCGNEALIAMMRERDALREQLAQAQKALKRLLPYRDHGPGCEVTQTDFCTCGMAQAAADAINGLKSGARGPLQTDGVVTEPMRDATRHHDQSSGPTKGEGLC